MHATSRSYRRAGLWLGAWVVRTAVAVSGRAAPQEPANKAASPAEKRVHFEFNGQRWSEVLAWFSKETELPLISVHVPTGTFTFKPTKASYTIPEVVDILN